MSNEIKRQRILVAWLVYVVAVHSVDCLATRHIMLGIDWSFFLWRTSSGFDLFKALAWFALPLALSLSRFEAGYFSFKRWKRGDLLLLLGLFAVGALAVGAIMIFPSLRGMYPSMGSMSSEAKFYSLRINLFFLASWIVGWEFIHRYVLVKAIRDAFPRHALTVTVALVPLIEALYHVGQRKPPLECLGVLFYGVVLCAWASLRRNTLLPFFAHLFIELALLGFLVLV